MLASQSVLEVIFFLSQKGINGLHRSQSPLISQNNNFRAPCDSRSIGAARPRTEAAPCLGVNDLPHASLAYGACDPGGRTWKVIVCLVHRLADHGPKESIQELIHYAAA